MPDDATSFTIETIEVAVEYVESPTPVETSLGTMTARPAVFLRIRDKSGAVGNGEIWCNFPACGAPHRAQLLEAEIAPRCVGKNSASPKDLFERLSSVTHRITVQTGEFGPFAQCIADLDVAVWDMLARRANTQLYRLMGGTNPTVPVYASGINPTGVEDTGARLIGDGQRRLKLRFGAECDLKNAHALQGLLGHDGTLKIDVNQA